MFSFYSTSTSPLIILPLLISPFLYLLDKEYFDRRTVLWAAILFWSLATSLAGLSQTLTQLVVIRSLVGVGEAAYGTIAPPMLSDFYPVRASFYCRH